MPTFPCASKIQGCCGGQPLLGLDAAAADARDYLAVNFGGMLGAFAGLPFLGQGPVQPCYATADSYVSQQAAELQAAEAAGICTTNPPGNYSAAQALDGGPGNNEVFNLTEAIADQPENLIFFNQPQTASSACPVTGDVFQYEVPYGVFAGTSQQAADESALSYAQMLAPLNRICVGAINSPIAVGQAVLEYVVVSNTGSSVVTPNATALYTWSVSGALPPGTSLSPQAGKDYAYFQGTPTTAGAYTFMVTVTDNNGNSMTKTYTVLVGGLTNGSALPLGMEGTAYAQQLLAAGFANSVNFSLASGVLPLGLSLSATGLISGTPTQNGNSSFVVKLTDSVTGFTANGLVQMGVTSPMAYCCNCGYAAQIQGYSASMFLYNAAGLVAATATITTATLAGNVWTVGNPGGGLPGERSQIYYVEAGGVWYQYISKGATQGTMTPWGASLTAGASAACWLTAGTVFVPQVLTFYTLANGADFGPEWNGLFNITDAGGWGTCATQPFYCVKLNGLPGVGVWLDVSDGFVWTLTLIPAQLYASVVYHNVGVVDAYVYWQGQFTGPTPFGVYYSVAEHSDHAIFLDTSFPLVCWWPETLTLTPGV